MPQLTWVQGSAHQAPHWNPAWQQWGGLEDADSAIDWTTQVHPLERGTVQQQWLSQTQSLDHISSEPVVVTARLSRRVQHAINSF